jgi:two-component system, chemotaxis family, protein-glutamate methylesterase/glutaminase
MQTSLSPTAAPGAAGISARVMICDDSLVIRGAVARMLQSDPRIRVLARPANGRQALAEMARQKFDVIILDIEMPEMDGMTALPLLLRADPSVRVIMASTLTTRGAEIAMRALRLGAADYVPKPSVEAIADDSFRRELLAKVVGLARLRRASAGDVGTPGARAAPALRPAARLPARVLAIGSSTGGPQALFTLVRGLGRAPRVPVLLTQHMPATFTPLLAQHIDRLGALSCAEAQDGEILRPGHIHLAPGDRHMLVRATPSGMAVKLTQDPPENFCRPSVDPMLRSASAACDGRVLVAMLTGMGHDGLAGTKAVIAAGGTALAQDEASSVVWGMPGAIAQAGLCHAVLPLPSLAPKLLSLLSGTGA